MPNSIYTYILNIYMFCKHILKINELVIILLYIVKWFQVLLSNSNNLTSVICLYTLEYDL